MSDSEPAAAIAENGASLADHLFEVAQLHAARMGLSGEDADDCAMAFVERVLQALQTNELAPRSEAWLHHCAHNHAKNCRRADARLRQHEQHWPEVACVDGAHLIYDCLDSAPMLEADMLRQEFWQRTLAAVEQLKPVQRELLMRHHLQDESLESLAASSGRTVPAVKQSLLRARRRLRALLIRQGLTEAELQEYCTAFSAPPHADSALAPSRRQP